MQSCIASQARRIAANIAKLPDLLIVCLFAFVKLNKF
jgi:hypothetical protein